jgi:DNA invertase Pin-like site-specific DNA recombinase
MVELVQDPARRIRCAIYTRKSTEDGLEQEFNSLDAQREACAAYILSQRHEGWTLVPGDYDDGGCSGGNMERPALRRLLDEVRARRVDVIVVYKIDRLTRSLADFARIVDVLDAANASFVSVTQAFNTTTSMGRLTLNVLLSFAQFEREVTGERIRDKIAASKARGMWMGGVVPLGYEVRERKLVVVEEEAATVRHIFQRYVALGSAMALREELDQQGVRSKRRVTRDGRKYGNTMFSRGSLYQLLQNKLYVGQVTHKGVAYPGEHEGIVDPKLFETAQARLDANRVDRKLGTNAAQPSPLAGLVWDEHGRRMSPQHTNKASKRFRYYVSRTENEEARAPAWRLPAGDLEELVIGRVRALLMDPGAIQQALRDESQDAAAIAERLHAARALARDIGARTHGDLRRNILRLVLRVEVLAARVDIHVSRESLRKLGGSRDHAPGPPEEPLVLSAPAVRARVGKDVRLVIGPAREVVSGRRDGALIKLVVKAHAARRAIEAGTGKDLETLARGHGYARDYFSVLLRLAYLAPDITSAILEGRHPVTLTRQKLARCPIPLKWEGQRKALGFS